MSPSASTFLWVPWGRSISSAVTQHKHLNGENVTKSRRRGGGRASGADFTLEEPTCVHDNATWCQRATAKLSSVSAAEDKLDVFAPAELKCDPMTWSDPRSAHSWHFHRRLLQLHVLHLLHGHFSKAGQVISATFDFPAEESFQAFSRKRTMERLTRLCGVMTSQAERPWLAVWHVHGATYDTGCRWVVQTEDKSRLCFVTSAAVTGLTVWPVLTCYCDRLWTGGTERAGLSFIKLTTTSPRNVSWTAYNRVTWHHKETSWFVCTLARF